MWYSSYGSKGCFAHYGFMTVGRKVVVVREWRVKNNKSNLCRMELLSEDYWDISLVMMMEFSFPPHSPFLALSGEPPVPSTWWHESFEIFVAAVRLAEASNERQKAMLIHNLGSEGQRTPPPHTMLVWQNCRDIWLHHRAPYSDRLFFTSTSNN